MRNTGKQLRVSPCLGWRVTVVRSGRLQETVNIRGAKDICESVNGTRIIKRTVIIKKRAIWPVSS